MAEDVTWRRWASISATQEMADTLKAITCFFSPWVLRLPTTWITLHRCTALYHCTTALHRITAQQCINVSLNWTTLNHNTVQHCTPSSMQGCTCTSP